MWGTLIRFWWESSSLMSHDIVTVIIWGCTAMSCLLPRCRCQRVNGNRSSSAVRGVDFSNWMNGWSHPCSGIINSSLLSVYPVWMVASNWGGGRRRLARSGRPEVHALSWLLEWLLASLEDSSSDLWLFGPEATFTTIGASWALVIVGFTFQRGLNNKSHRGSPSSPHFPDATLTKSLS